MLAVVVVNGSIETCWTAGGGSYKERFISNNKRTICLVAQQSAHITNDRQETRIHSIAIKQGKQFFQSLSAANTSV
jgi:hypothetical protein